MPLVTLKQVLRESVKKRYAVAAFDTVDHMLSEAMIQAAEEKGVPFIVMVAGFDLDLDIMDAKNFMPYLTNRIERSSVPIALHLDHADSYESCMKAINYGFSGVMIDASSKPYEENVALTKKVVEAAHAAGVSVEAELGHVAGGEGNLEGGAVADRSAFTDPDEAVRYVEETGVDALAIAFGTVHGVYKGKSKLDHGLLKKIRSSIDIPIVMHGGSGLNINSYKAAIKNGINKINFFTGMSLAAVATLRKVIEEKDGYIHYPQVIYAAKAEVVKIVKKQIEIFGTQPLHLK